MGCCASAPHIAPENTAAVTPVFSPGRHALPHVITLPPSMVTVRCEGQTPEGDPLGRAEVRYKSGAVYEGRFAGPVLVGDGLFTLPPSEGGATMELSLVDPTSVEEVHALAMSIVTARKDHRRSSGVPVTIDPDPRGPQPMPADAHPAAFLLVPGHGPRPGSGSHSASSRSPSESVHSAASNDRRRSSGAHHTEPFGRTRHNVAPARAPSAASLQTQPPSGQAECVVCMEGPKTHAVVPCGHRCLCRRCASNTAQLGRKCPVCRGSLDAIIQVFD